MVEIIYTDKFEKEVKKLDLSIKTKVIKHIGRIIEAPNIGKPLRYNLKGERTIYVKPYRIIYAIDKNSLIFLRVEHRKSVY
jgi:addiction module RelE/StbE family toxin